MRQAITAPGAPPAAGNYSHAVRAGDFLFISGQVPRDSAGAYEPADVETETHRTLANLATIATSAGAQLADAVKITAYLADQSYSAAFNQAYNEYFDTAPPARTTVVAGLRDVKVELDAIIYLGAHLMAQPLTAPTTTSAAFPTAGTAPTTSSVVPRAETAPASTASPTAKPTPASTAAPTAETAPANTATPIAPARAQPPRISNAALYASSSRTLTHYALDAESCTLDQRGELRLPNAIQSGWPHPHLPVLYVSCGSPPPGDDAGDWVCAVGLDPNTGAPSLLGPATRITSRALHLTTDRTGAHLVLAHTRPAGLSVLRTGPDGAIVGSVEQRPDIDIGAFPHQVRVTPDDRFCIVVARGLPNPHEWNAKNEPQAAPGAVHVMTYDHGTLGESTSIGPEDGSHFGPRNLDFGPSRSRFYLLLETQNELVVFDSTSEDPTRAGVVQRMSTLADPAARVHQGAGPILVHPHHNVVYVANRSYQPGPGGGGPRVLPAEAENSIVVYGIDSETGLVTEIQRLSSGGVCPRTLSLDPTGQMLIVANSETYDVVTGDVVSRVPMNLSTFRVCEDGRLELAHRYETGDGTGPEIAWSGIASFH